MTRDEIDGLVAATRRREVTWEVDGRYYKATWLGWNWELYVGTGTHKALTRAPLADVGPIAERRVSAEIGLFPRGRAVFRLADAVEAQFVD